MKTETGPKDIRIPLPLWTIPLRIAIAIAVTGGALLLAARLTGVVPDATDPTATSTLVARIAAGFAVSVAVLGLIVLLVRVVKRRPSAELGLTTIANDFRAFLIGTAAWAIPAVLAFAVLSMLGSPIRVNALPPDFWFVLGLVFLAVLLSEAIPEELVFRGYISAVLAERLSPWWVIGVQTLLFTATAIVLRGSLNVLDASLFVAMGFVLGYVRLVSGSVWAAVGIHVAFQTASQLVFTHDVIEFLGSNEHAMIALGAVPFTTVAILIPLLPWPVWRADRTRES